MSTSNLVSVGKPAVAGAIFVAPLGTALPTTANATLNASFTDLGYASEDGVTNNMTKETSVIKAWGGDEVLPLQTGFSDTFAFTLIESLNVDVLKTVFNSANVSGTLATGISVAVDGAENPQMSWVVDMYLRNGGKKRIVIPSASITELAEITYKDDTVIGYNVTLRAMRDSSGKAHYEYTLRPVPST